MKFTNYLILTELFAQYGTHRFNEGMFMEARMQEEQLKQKALAQDVWERAFAIIKEMEDANEEF